MTARATSTFAIGVLTIATLLGGGAGVSTAASPVSESTVAIAALTGTNPIDAMNRVPRAFVDAFYSPTVENGMLVNPDGDCSSPIPLPVEFDTACKAHDLGYDLIRFGSATGNPTSAQAREDLDASLRASMDGSCDSRTGIGSRSICHLMSAIAGTAVDVNSWRQGYGTPAPEPAMPFLLVGLACMAVAIPVLTRRASAL